MVVVAACESIVEGVVQGESDNSEEANDIEVLTSVDELEAIELGSLLSEVFAVALASVDKLEVIEPEIEVEEGIDMLNEVIAPNL